MPSISTPTVAPPSSPKLAARARLWSDPRTSGRPPQRGDVEGDPGRPDALEPDGLVGQQPGDRRPGSRRRRRSPARNAAWTAAAVSCWMRWPTSGQARAGSIVSISSWVVRSNRRIRAWKANSVRVRSAANSSSSRTDQDASASVRTSPAGPGSRAGRWPGARASSGMVEGGELGGQRRAQLVDDRAAAAAIAVRSRTRPGRARRRRRRGLARTPGSRSRRRGRVRQVAAACLRRTELSPIRLVVDPDCPRGGRRRWR